MTESVSLRESRVTAVDLDICSPGTGLLRVTVSIGSRSHYSILLSDLPGIHGFSSLSTLLNGDSRTTPWLAKTKRGLAAIDG
jgi:hypothetical protein